MKALIYEGEGNIIFKEIPKPRLENGEAFIKVTFAGICGTDLPISEGEHPRAKPPLIVGHEFLFEEDLKAFQVAKNSKGDQLEVMLKR
jgi:D-arabinose 1-dehydrogenase-like Zn-dependent alcohol dehydrogenase